MPSGPRSGRSITYNMQMLVQDLGTLSYRDAWRLQEDAHEQVVGGAQERILLVEHPPVITMGRRPGINQNLLASEEQLKQLHVELVESDRGGDITFHGPGQIVAYPIIRLSDHNLSVGGYVRALEVAVISALRELGLAAQKDTCAVGVWIDDATGAGTLAKLCAIGVRIRRGTSLHGLALNVNTDLSYFDLIVPCGLKCRPVTSMRKLMGDKTPSMQTVKDVLTRHLIATLEQRDSASVAQRTA